MTDGVPTSMPFLRVFWLEYARPHYKGRLLYGADVAYLFGEWPTITPGHQVVPGRCIDTSADGRQANHPCPRKISHVLYLVDKCSTPGDIVLDPFLGSGTTLLACRQTQRIGLGFELNPKYESEIKRRSLAEIPDITSYSDGQSQLSTSEGGSQWA